VMGINLAECRSTSMPGKVDPLPHLQLDSGLYLQFEG
jgi:hypothetical protein